MVRSKKVSGDAPPRQACEICGAVVPSHECISVACGGGKYRLTCERCFNAQGALAGGYDDFEHVRLEPILLDDCAGKRHEFHFRRYLFGDRVSLEAFELEDGSPSGYQFQMLGDPEEEALELLARLVQRMRRRLAEKHLEDGEYGLQIAGQTVRGSITSNPEDWTDVPVLVIDGREVSWEEFGRMLTTFEGWQFRLEIVDRSEDV